MRAKVRPIPSFAWMDPPLGEQWVEREPGLFERHLVAIYPHGYSPLVVLRHPIDPAVYEDAEKNGL